MKRTDLDSLNRDSREFIVQLFKGRCCICYNQGTEVNEIIPRSRGKDSLRWQNKVLMCHKHHEDFHLHGVSPEAIQNLQEKRIKYLIAIGREDYLE